MGIRNVLAVTYTPVCPHGESEVIKSYLENLFGEISEIASPYINQKKLDWLVINSYSLADITFTSMNFFPKMLLKKMKEHGTGNIQIDCCMGHACGDSDISLIEKVRETDGEKSTIQYLTSGKVGNVYVGYKISVID